MAEVICMPKLGFNMDEGQLVRWCKAVGEEVKKGEVLFEINTDKTTMPVEATGDGVLLKTMLGRKRICRCIYSDRSCWCSRRRCRRSTGSLW